MKMADAANSPASRRSPEVSGGAYADRPAYPEGRHDGRLVGRSVPDHRRNEGILPPEHRIALLRATLKALLTEAKSGQHRRDRQGMKCPPMEAAIERAERELSTHD